MEGEVNIRFEPFKEIIVLERSHFPSLEDLARFTSIVTGGKPGALYWADGVAFVYFPLSINTEATAKALIEEGKVYWAFLSYSMMPEYRPLVETKEKIIVPVINMSMNPLFQKVAKWVKEQHVQKP